WFIFHLLSAVDLQNVRRANAHFSEDLLSVLLNEPIPGQGVFWSSAGSTIYPISLRALLFEQLVQRQDFRYDRPEVATYAVSLREKYQSEVWAALARVRGEAASDEDGGTPGALHGQVVKAKGSVDVFRVHQERAIETLRNSGQFVDALNRGGVPWG